MRIFFEKFRPLYAAEGGGSGSGNGASAPGAASTAPLSSTPSPSTPPAATPSPGDAAPSPEPFDFSAIFNDGGDSGVTEVPPAAATTGETPKTPEAKPVAGAEPATKAKPEKPADDKPAAAAPGPKETPSTAPAPASVEPAAPQLDPLDPASVAQALVKHEAATIEHVAKELFKLTPEEIEALETDTVGEIPKLLAKSYVKMQTAVLGQMARMIPQMIQKHNEVVKRNSENEGKFFARWPSIKAAEHGNLVRRYAYTYRQMHPQASLDQMIEDLGPMIMMAAKIVPQPATPGSGQPASPMTNGVRPPQPAPFVPAGAGAGAASSSQAPELSEVEAMFLEQNQ